MSDIKVNVTAEGGNDVIIRTGEALPPKAPKNLELSGVLETPADFAENRKANFDHKDAHVIANYTGRTISLTTHQSEPYKTATVVGALRPFPDLAKLAVNRNKEYNAKELFQALNFMGRYFPDRDAHKDLLKKLEQFRAKVTQEFVNEDDFKGTAATSKLTKIEQDVPLSFDLGIPIFSGESPKTFKVEILCTVRNGGVSYWLESVELDTLEKEGTDELFEAQLSRFNADIAIVRQCKESHSGAKSRVKLIREAAC
jgi:hypothetical protein